MNETTNLSHSGLFSDGVGTTSNLYSGTPGTAYTGTAITTITDGLGSTLQGNSTINHSSTPTPVKKMALKQVNVAVFTITRDEDTNEINSTKFVKQLWIEQKNGTSIDLLVAKQLGNDFDPETTIIKVLSTVSF
jgi:hypothetical protein